MSASVPTNPQFESFLKLVHGWCRGYRRAVRSWIAIRPAQAPLEWKLLGAELVFNAAETAEGLRPFTINTESLWAGVEITELDPRGVLQLLEAIRSEPLVFTTQGGDLLLRSDQTDSVTKTSVVSDATARSHNANYTFYPLGRLPVLDGRRHASLQISTSQFGNPVIPDRTRLDLELFNADLPINGIGDLLSRLGKPDAIIQGFQMPTIDIIAIAPAYLQRDSALRDGTGQIRVSAPPGLDHSRFSLGLVCVEKSSPSHSLAISNEKIAWKELDGRFVGTTDLHVRAPAVVAFLRYDGQYFDRLHIANVGQSLNDLHELHRTIDTDDHLRRLLTSTDATAFERGVALLLGILGLSVLHYGGIPEFGDGPDSYAVSAGADLYVIECTTGHPDHKGKLQKAHNRAARIHDLSQRRGLMFKNIQPVLVTTTPRANTIEIAAQAADLNIALVCREDLTHWHNVASTAHIPTAEEFQATVLALVPRRTPDMLNYEPDRLD